MRESHTPISASNMKKDFSSSDLSDTPEEGSKVLSESTPDMPTCESYLTYPRCLTSFISYFNKSSCVLSHEGKAFGWPEKCVASHCKILTFTSHNFSGSFNPFSPQLFTY